MTDKQLREALNGVGKEKFVRNYDLLKTHGRGEISRVECLRELGHEHERVRSNGANIFKGGRECDALSITSVSEGVPMEAHRPGEKCGLASSSA